MVRCIFVLHQVSMECLVLKAKFSPHSLKTSKQIKKVGFDIVWKVYIDIELAPMTSFSQKRVQYCMIRLRDVCLEFRHRNTLKLFEYFLFHPRKLMSGSHEFLCQAEAHHDLCSCVRLITA